MGINHPLPYTTLYPPIAQYIHVRNVLGRAVILNPTRGTEPAVPAEECVWAIGLWHVHPLHVRKLPAVETIVQTSKSRSVRDSQN